MKEYNPLVSVGVVSYNSANTIVETLDSIAKQTYNNIELIVSDDGSKDNTVEICKKWIEDNKSRFVSCEVITVTNNTGTAANENRAVKAAKGEWYKPIAADDILLPSCICDNIKYVSNNPAIDILFSKVELFGDTSRFEKVGNLFKYHYFMLPPKAFFVMILSGNFIPAPTTFIKRSIYNQIGYYDESIPLMEDWPFWMKATYNRCIIGFNDIFTVKYRVGESVSLFNTITDRYKECGEKAISLSRKYQMKTSILLFLYIRMKQFEKSKNKLSVLFSYLLRIINLFNPYYWYMRKIGKKYNLR